MDAIPIILAIAAAITSAVTLILQKRKDTPDIAEKYEAMASRCQDKIEKLGARLEELEKQVHDQETELGELRSGVVLLIAQLKAIGQTPVWTPKEKAKA